MVYLEPDAVTDSGEDAGGRQLPGRVDRASSSREIVAEAWRQKNKRPPKSGRAEDRFSPSPASCGYLAGVSVVTTPEGPAFSALAFLVAMVLSTQSSADFRSALRASGLSHSKSARSRYIKFR